MVEYLPLHKMRILGVESVDMLVPGPESEC